MYNGLKGLKKEDTIEWVGIQEELGELEWLWSKHVQNSKKKN